MDDEGWDDDLDFDDDEEAEPQPNSNNEGWDDDDDLEFSEHTDNNTTTHLPDPQPSPRTNDAPPINNDGWDDFDLSESNHNENEQESSLSKTNQQKPESGGWGDDDDLFGDDDEGDVTSPPHNQESPLVKELRTYLDRLPVHVPSVNAILAAEYNTLEGAHELYTYLLQRPQLFEYTLNKELGRMQYTVIVNGQMVDEPEQIRHVLRASSDPSKLLIRAANQSLLADFIHVLTANDDCLVPHKYFGSVVAKQCHFTIDMDANTVFCKATLNISLPSMNGRFHVAECRASIVFGLQQQQQQPFVEFQMVDLVPLPYQSHDLTQCATMLHELQLAHHEDDTVPPSSTSNYRDDFVTALSGFSMAWSELDAATGLGQKLQRLNIPADTYEDEVTLAQNKPRPTSILGGFVSRLAQSVALPDEEEQYEAYREQSGGGAPSLGAFPRPQQSGAFPRPESVQGSFPRPQPPPPPQGAFPRPEVPQQRQGAFPRPDPQPITTSHAPSRGQEGTFPKLYNPETPKGDGVAAIPKLYNTETPPPMQPQRQPNGAFPKLYTTKETPKPEPQSFPKLYNTNTPPPVNEQNKTGKPEAQQDKDDEIEDGWGSDGADEMDFDDNDDTPEETEPQVEDLSNYVYDPETDIIPTRKRWVNPRRDACRTLMVTSSSSNEWFLQT